MITDTDSDSHADSHAHVGAETPTELMAAFAARLNGGDLDGLMDLYEPDAVFEPEPGATLHGAAAIREALAGLLGLQPTLTSEVQRVLIAGDIALVANAWAMVGRAPDGTEVRRGGVSADVLRRTRGRWRVVVDRPAV